MAKKKYDIEEGYKFKKNSLDEEFAADANKEKKSSNNEKKADRDFNKEKREITQKFLSENYNSFSSLFNYQNSLKVQRFLRSRH